MSVLPAAGRPLFSESITLEAGKTLEKDIRVKRADPRPAGAR